MKPSFADRNLLLGVLGLQLQLIEPQQMISAMRKWVGRKQEPIEVILREDGILDQQQIDFLLGIAEKHMSLHKDNAAHSLATLSTFETIQVDLEALHDKDIDDSLTRVAGIRSVVETDALDVTQDLSYSEAKAPSLGQRFRILRPHARGGLGQVSIAEDAELHREVALKEIQPQFATDPGSRNRFMIEAELTGRLEHPGIVPVYSLGKTTDGNPFYVMRFIRR